VKHSGLLVILVPFIMVVKMYSGMADSIPWALYKPKLLSDSRCLLLQFIVLGKHEADFLCFVLTDAIPLRFILPCLGLP